jgi:hypothetical protein
VLALGGPVHACALLLMPLTKLGVAVLHRALTGAWPHWGKTHPLCSWRRRSLQP